MQRAQQNIEQVTVSLPVDKQLSEGFAVSAAVHVLLFLGLIAWVLYDPPQQAVPHVPMEMIRLGLGNGPGSGGNLSPGGNPLKGPEPDNPLEDASRQQQSRQKVNPADVYEPGKRVVAANVSDAKHSRDSLNTHGTKNVGARDGSVNGTGLAGSGIGVGSGLGFGIDWGGGGNRIVLNKVLPAYPPGANKNAQIKYRFVVNPDGSIQKMFPTQKGDPRMEEEVQKALRQWRFNPLPNPKDAQPQMGEITFSFKVS